MKLTLKDKLEAQAAAKETQSPPSFNDTESLKRFNSDSANSKKPTATAKEEPAKAGTTNGKKDHRPVVASAQVVKAARNENYVYASLDGERISVLCRGRDRDRIIGKRINVLVSEFDGKPIYEHQP